MRKTIAIILLLLCFSLNSTEKLGKDYRRARVLYGYTRYEEAIKFFKKVARHYTNNGNPVFYIGLCYEKLYFEKKEYKYKLYAISAFELAISRKLLRHKFKKFSYWKLIIYYRRIKNWNMVIYHTQNFIKYYEAYAKVNKYDKAYHSEIWALKNVLTKARYRRF